MTTENNLNNQFEEESAFGSYAVFDDSIINTPKFPTKESTSAKNDRKSRKPWIIAACAAVILAIIAISLAL